MANPPYAVPANYVIRLVEEGGIASASTQPQQPSQASYPHHYEFPRKSLHHLTLKSHFHGPHAPSSVRTATLGAWAPTTDIRETQQFYHIEIETPGVTDKEQLLIQWMTPHTLLVQGNIKRPANIGLLDEQEGTKVWEGERDGWATENGHGEEEEADGGPIERQPSRETVEAQLLAETVPTILLGERKVGPWRRTFTLPDDVEMRELKARLEAGLLRIDLPKRSIETENDVKHGGIRIEIE